MNTKTEEIQILDFTVTLVKKDIKNMHLSVYPDGKIRVSAPKDLSDEAIRLYVIGKIRWIKKHQQNFANQQRETPREYITGESHYFEGRRYLINVIEQYGKHEIKIRNKKYLDLYVNPKTTKEGKERVFKQWYKEHLRDIISELLEKWKRILDIHPQCWEIKQMQTKWGSCKVHSKKIIFNLELAKKPRHCIEYVVLHELIHLIERHHNNNFKAYLDRYMPNWQAIKHELDSLPIC